MITRYYCTEKRGITFKESATTIPANDERVKSFFEFDLANKALDMEFTVDGLPLVKEYALDANGERYSDYLTEPDVDGIYQPDAVAIDARAVEQQQKSLEQAVQSHLDSKARERGYDNIVSACSYATSTGTFGTEGQAYVEWRDSVWTYCYNVLSQVQAGTRVAPTIDELIAELPTAP